MTTSLAEKTCKPVARGAEPITDQQLGRLHAQLTGWRLVEKRSLIKTFKFPDFTTALAFVNRVGELAEQQNHHPLIHLTWGRVTVDLWTHAVRGLSENDFILAAKIDALPTD